MTNSVSEPISNGHARKVSFEDIQLVQNLIERCLQLYMSQDEVIKTLLNQARIEPGFTGLELKMSASLLQMGTCQGTL